MDVAEHLQAPRLLPAREIDVEQAAAGNGAGVVDENVGRRMRRRELFTRVRPGEVGHKNCRAFADLRLRLGQAAGVARDQHDLDAFGRERLRTGKADALRRAGDDRRLALQTQIHVFLPIFVAGILAHGDDFSNPGHNRPKT